MDGLVTRACNRITTCMKRAVYESTLEPLALQEKLGVIPYYSLASGFLTGKYRSSR